MFLLDARCNIPKTEKEKDIKTTRERKRTKGKRKLKR